MSTPEELVSTILARSAGAQRFIVAIAGPPGAGKSIASTRLAEMLPEGQSAIIQADGFHYDNALLDALGRRQRKGAEDTFDCRGLEITLERLRSMEADVVVPVFDRELDVSRACAGSVAKDTRYILVEGNYLLLNRQPWAGLAKFFDFLVFVSWPRTELERRLLERWTDLGHTMDAARNWVTTNDLPNVDIVRQHSRTADFVLSS